MPVGGLATIINFTKYDPAEEAQWLKAIFGASRDGILIEDNELIVRANSAYAHLFGYDDPAELIGKHISVVLSPDDGERMLDFGRRRLKGEPAPQVYEFRGRRRDGTLIELEASVSTSTVEGRAFITTAIRDITERKRTEKALWQLRDELEHRVAERTIELARANEVLRAEAAERERAEETLRESEQRLKLALQTSRLGSWQLDLTTGELTSSDICKANFGLSPEAELSYTVLFEAIHAGDRERVREAIRQAVESHSDYDAEYRNVWPDGSTHWIIARGRSLYDADGKPVRMVGVTLDISERKRNEEARQSLLRRLVAAQEDERRRIARELHDQLGQQLTALIWGLKSLEDVTQESPPERQRLCQLQELAEQLRQQVHTLAWELRPATLDDLGLLTATSNYADQWAERYGVAVDFQSIGFNEQRLPPTVETIVYRVVQEALTNVCKHAQARRVGVILEHHLDYLRAVVEDDGCGFDTELILGSCAAKRGLGLLGMRERVESVGGTLTIESTPGAGSTIFARIPAKLCDE